MATQRIYLYCILLMTTATLKADPLLEAQIYKWVDEAGVIHYSDSSPANPVTNLKTLTLPPPGSSNLKPNSDYYSVLNQARRMKQSRLAREQEQAAKRTRHLSTRKDIGYVKNKPEKSNDYIAYYPVRYISLRRAKHHHLHRIHHLKMHRFHKKHALKHKLHKRHERHGRHRIHGHKTVSKKIARTRCYRACK